MGLNSTPAADRAMRIKYHERQIATLIAESTAADRFGEDVYENGVILVFDKVYSNEAYSYAVLKAKNRWYSTSSVSTAPMTWTDLVNFLTEKPTVTELWIVTQLEKVED